MDIRCSALRHVWDNVGRVWLVFLVTQLTRTRRITAWENAVVVLQNSFTGPIARGLALVSIVVGGLMFAFGEGDSKRMLAGIVLRRRHGHRRGQLHGLALPVNCHDPASCLSRTQQAAHDLGSGTAAVPFSQPSSAQRHSTCSRAFSQDC